MDEGSQDAARVPVNPLAWVSMRPRIKRLTDRYLRLFERANYADAWFAAINTLLPIPERES